MKYFLFFIPLFIYFELFGRYIFYKLGKQYIDFPFIVGFVFTIAILYLIGWPISAFNRSSIAYVILLLIYFLITSILIIKDFKYLKFKIDNKLWLVFLILVIFECCLSYTRTLGEPHGFDVVYYINYISENLDISELNSLNPLFGTYPNYYETTITYVFQSYNYFISSFIYIIQKLFNLINKEVDFLPTYVWTFQILLNMVFVGTSLISIKELKIKNRILQVALTILLILFMNNFYYNNAFGFIGNSYRMSIHAIATIFLFRYFNSKDHKDLFLFFISMLGLCGFSSTGTFATVFILFGLFYVIYDKEKDLIKYYALVLFTPCLNILIVKLDAKWWVVVATLILFVIIYFLNDWLLKIFRNNYLRYGMGVIIALFLIIMSFTITHDFFNFYGFIKNYSEWQDMSWDYFDFYDLRHWLFNLLVLIPLFFHIFKNRKHPFSIICIVLILTVFNPFGATFMNKINWVYYRTYDIIINQFTIAYFINYLISSTTKQTIISTIVLAMSATLTIIQIPRYYHESFIPDDDYNPIYKIENSELEMIRNVNQLIKDYNIENPKIINTTFYMNSFIKNGIYLIGKERTYNFDDYDDISYALYLIFYPSDGYDNFRSVDTPDYDNVINYLKESDYNILVVENGLYVNYRGEYMPLNEAITSDGTFEKSTYSTNKYAVIILNN